MIPLRGKPARALAAALRSKPREKRPRKAKLPGVRESAVVRDVGLYLDAIPGNFFRVNAGAVVVGGRRVVLAPAGVSDFVGCLPDGRFLAVECKRPRGGKLSAAQRQWQAVMRELGALVVGEARSCREVWEALIAAGYGMPAPDPRLL